jgi:16S rRNA (adenine1518-N6/adenine1519-N6)-dimethyltransferase
MLQKEVVQRMVAAPGTSAYGRLSVMLQYRFEMEHLLTVPAAAFRPAPRVESAVVRMVPFARPPHRARDEAALARIVAAAFSQRRKTLRNTLKAHFRTADFERLGVDPGLRAQDLGVEEFVRLADEFLKKEYPDTK